MRAISIITAALVTTSCSSPNANVTKLEFGSSEVLTTTGSLRLITERQRPGYLPVACTEPSPDYAVAFGTKAGGNAKVTIPEGSSGEGAASFERSEAITNLGGREAAVLALRDGLYAACQSYANGVIGHDAYAMILSQYGALLVALVGNEDANSAGRSSATRQATLSALVVACISGHDETRYSPILPNNRLLTTQFCRNVLNGALQRSLRT